MIASLFTAAAVITGCVSQPPTSPDGQDGPTSPDGQYGSVTDLTIKSIEGSTATLSFTEVRDTTGAAADYRMRFQLAPLDWATASSVTYGTCSGRLAGTSIGNKRTCTVENLAPGSTYEFQVVAFAGQVSSESEEVSDDLSNVVAATMPSSTPGDAFLSFDFDKYSSTENLHQADEDFMGGREDLGLSRIYLDTDEGFDGLSKSMRYDWIDQGTDSQSRGRGIFLPEERRELWVEIVIKWSSNFTTCHPEDPPCDHKTMFLQVWPDESGRWAVHFGGGGASGPQAPVTVGLPAGDKESGNIGNTGVMANKYFDDEWHVVRWHVRHSTDVDTRDGLVELWVDGEKLKTVTNFSTNDDTRVRAILLGRNKDKGRDSGTESMWVGRVRAWDVNPGW